MIDKTHLRSLIEKTLRAINLHSKDAENLVLGTAAQESGLGKYLRQLNGGPAVGIFQMEPFTFDDIVNNYLKYKPDLSEKILKYCGVTKYDVRYLEWNLAFACAMTRVYYLRVKEKLPKSLPGYAKYWKKYYNTYKGKGTEAEFIKNYQKYKL